MPQPFNFNFTPPRQAGFNPPVSITGDCLDGHRLTRTAPLLELRAGNTMVYCGICASWVLPRWDFSKIDGKPEESEALHVSNQQFSGVAEMLFRQE